MGDSLDTLAGRVARGNEEAARELGFALRTAEWSEVQRMASHRSALVRQVVARIVPGRVEPQAMELASRLAADARVEVRRALAETLADDPGWGSDELYHALLDDAEEQVREVLIEPASQRESLLDTLTILALEDASLTLRARLCTLLAMRHPERAVPVLVESIAYGSREVERAAALALHEIVRKRRGLPEVLALPADLIVRAAIAELRESAPRKFARLIAELEKRAPPIPEGQSKPEAGAVSRAADEVDVSGERAHHVEHYVDALLAILRRPRGRAAMLIGESGAGKTAVVHELARRELRPGVRPRLVRMTPTDFLAGTKYLGDWESKLETLVQSLRNDERAVLYIPGAHTLDTVGTTVHSTNNVAAALGPHIESGALAVIGETTPSDFAAGLGRNAAMRRLWTTVELPPSDRRRTLSILRAICEDEHVVAGDALLERVIDYSEMFVGSTAQPGQSAGLLRAVLTSLAKAPLTLAGVLAELSRRTGVPADLLDDERPLDLASLRRFFEERVMGQHEAIDSVVDLVTLFKAGLNDPNKPLAVLLFVGPTGVGKTELARALAERLFGDASRLVRFDMSEYATYEAFERLHGSAHRQGALTNAVRERPLSVVLLDEIEKAHSNVFDLCLQIFDAGRLTDGSGRTVDFRRCIVIMTSNLGSAVSVDPRLGFAPAAPGAPGSDDVQRALRAFFRPEFLARLDRVVHFQPLSLESAEQIARRELARVLRRGGIERRDLEIDVDPALVQLLLREGYTQAFGARPLKRTIERRILLPVARAISTAPIEHGSVLKLRSSAAGEVLVDVVPPAAEASKHDVAPAPPSVETLRTSCAELVARCERLEHRASGWAELRTALVAATNSSSFWERREEAARQLDELHRVDQLLERVSRIATGARSLAEHASRVRTPKALAEASERAEQLKQGAALVERLAKAADAGALTDAIVELSSVRRSQGGLDGVLLLARMYRQWASRQGMEVETLSDRRGGDPFEDSLVLAVRGAGAFELLRGEHGLHVLAQTLAPDKQRRSPRTLRETIRVDVHPCADQAASATRPGLSASTRPLHEVKGREIAQPNLEARVFDSARAASAQVWTAAPPERALAHARLLLESRNAARQTPTDLVVRRYQLGPSPLVKDVRSRTQTGKLHRVLDGEIDAFLATA